MKERFFLFDNYHEVGLYKAPTQQTARILNDCSDANIEVFDDFAEAQSAAVAVFDRTIYQRRRWGLPTGDLEHMLDDMNRRGEDAVPDFMTA